MTIPLFCAVISSASQIFSALIASGASGITLNQSFLGGSIDSTTQNLDAYIRASEKRIVDELKRRHIKDSVQHLQANVSTMRQLLDFKDVDPSLVTQLVLSALNPLHVSLEVAKLRLAEHKEEEVLDYCVIAGTSALVAGYSYLGHNPTLLKAGLEALVLKTQRSMLNSVALVLIASGIEFPWERSSKLVTTEGADDLRTLVEEHSALFAENSEALKKLKIIGSVKINPRVWSMITV